MIKVTQGSVGYALEFSVTDSDGNPKDLTGYTINFKVWKKDETLKVNGTCDIEDATAGTCHYTVQSGDFDTLDAIVYIMENEIAKKASVYQAELELTKTGVLENTISDKLVLYESP